MQIIIPMAGMSQRFLNAGYRLPKTLLQIEGKTIIEHIVNKFSEEDKFIFICRKDQLEKTHMREVLHKIKPDGKIIEIEGHKLGPSFALNQIKDEISNTEPVIVNYCDFNWSWDYKKFKEYVNKTNCDGCVIGYTGFHPHLLHGNLYAGIKADEDGNVSEIKEKHRFTDSPMDTIHSSGTYYFKTGAIMKKYVAQQIDEKNKVNGEFYTSSTYEHLLNDGLQVTTFPVNKFMQWGTPEDLKEYLDWSNAFENGTAHELVVDELTQMTHDYWKEYFDSLNN